MRKLIRGTAIRWIVRLGLGLGCTSLSLVMGFAQRMPAAEIGADYNYVRANAPPDACGCFSMHGGSAWFAYSFTRSFAVVAEAGSQRASDIHGSGEDLTLTSYLFGRATVGAGPNISRPLARFCWAEFTPEEAWPRTVPDSPAHPTHSA